MRWNCGSLLKEERRASLKAPSLEGSVCCWVYGLNFPVMTAEFTSMQDHFVDIDYLILSKHISVNILLTLWIKLLKILGEQLG